MPRAHDTRERIERAALTLFAAKGVDATTTKDIAAGAGISEGAIYRHFTGKDQLASELFSTHYAALAGDVDAILAEDSKLASRVRRIVAYFCRLFDSDRDLFAFILLSQHGQLPKLQPHMPNPVDSLHRMFVEAAAAGECRADDPDLLAAGALGIVLQTAVFVLYGRLSGPLAPRADALAAAVLRAASP